jgi:hypothetical protein
MKNNTGVGSVPPVVFFTPECDGCGSMAFVALVHLPVAFAAVQKDSVIGLATNFNKPNGHNRWDF